VVADLADPATLGPALDGVDAEILASPGSADQVELEGDLVSAAAGAGGVRVVKLAALGYDAVLPEGPSRWVPTTRGWCSGCATAVCRARSSRPAGS
jgi:uncharacterized protein YbjT (DUF2867 family)